MSNSAKKEHLKEEGISEKGRASELERTSEKERISERGRTLERKKYV
jgi:hypothetical protein